jgi:hypothetical protein
VLRRVPPTAWIARGLASQLLGDRLHERSAPVELERPDGRGARLALERGLELALGLRPDPGHLSQPALARRLSQLLEVADSEHAPDLEHPLDRDSQEAAEPGELRRDFLELPQLGDLAGLDELL